MISVVGINEKAEEYLTKNSKYTKGGSVLWRDATGIVEFKASMYDIKKIDEYNIVLFEYELFNGKAKTKIQRVVDGCVFISLETPCGKEIKWSTKQVNSYLNNQKPLHKGGDSHGTETRK